MLDKIMVTGPEKHPRAAYARTAGTRLPRGRRGSRVLEGDADFSEF